MRNSVDRNDDDDHVAAFFPFLLFDFDLLFLFFLELEAEEEDEEEGLGSRKWGEKELAPLKLQAYLEERRRSFSTRKVKAVV